MRCASGRGLASSIVARACAMLVVGGASKGRRLGAAGKQPEPLRCSFRFEVAGTWLAAPARDCTCSERSHGPIQSTQFTAV